MIERCDLCVDRAVFYLRKGEKLAKGCSFAHGIVAFFGYMPSDEELRSSIHELLCHGG